MSMLSQAVTSQTCILGYAVPIKFEALTIQNEVSMDSLSLPTLLSLIMPARHSSQFSIHCHLFSRHSSQFSIHCHLFSRCYTTTAAEQTLKIKIHKSGNWKEALPSNHFGHGKSVSIKHYECVCIPVLVIRHEERMRRIMPSVACLVLPRFSILCNIKHHFRNTFTENKDV
jgi:hypothetical protein